MTGTCTSTPTGICTWRFVYNSCLVLSNSSAIEKSQRGKTSDGKVLFPVAITQCSQHSFQDEKRKQKVAYCHLQSWKTETAVRNHCHSTAFLFVKVREPFRTCSACLRSFVFTEQCNDELAWSQVEKDIIPNHRVSRLYYRWYCRHKNNKVSSSVFSQSPNYQQQQNVDLFMCLVSTGDVNADRNGAMQAPLSTYVMCLEAERIHWKGDIEKHRWLRYSVAIASSNQHLLHD